MGIVGLPNVGKSTLFNALTNKSVPAENYPFCTIDPSVGVVAVPDDRLWKLSEFSKSAKTVPAAIEFVDIAGLVRGASKGEGLGNQFLAHIREVDAIAQVVRVFEDSDILHVDGGPNPVRDIEVINLELILADMETVSKRLGNIEKDVKKGDKLAVIEKEILTRVRMILESEKLANALTELTAEERQILNGMHLLTMKPIIYVLNQKIGSKNVDTKPVTDFITNKLLDASEMDALNPAFYWEAHLMVKEPKDFLDYQICGFKTIILHYEAFPSADDVKRALDDIRAMGFKTGVAINPGTAVAVLKDIFADQYLIMSVVPGMQGQSFIPATTDRVKELRKLLPNAIIEVDGGINMGNIKQVARAGADFIVAGSAIVGEGNAAENFEKLKSEINKN